MKWGRKNTPLPSSPRPSLISSWIMKFKKMGGGTEAKQERVNQREKQNFTVTRSPLYGGGGRFYGGDGDGAFWRISFGEEGVAGENSARRVLKSVWYDSDDELDVPKPGFRSCRSSATKGGRREETQKFRKMASNEVNQTICYSRGNEEKLKTPRANVAKDSKLRKTRRRSLDENSELEKDPDSAEVKSEKTIVKEVVEMESVERNRRDRQKPTVVNSKIQSDRFSSRRNEDSEWQKLKEMKIQEFKSKTESNRKSVYKNGVVQNRRPKQNNKARVYSPRTVSKVEVCKIKALEDMKKAKLKMNKQQIKERIIEVKGRKGLENFAVVKCSFDPHKDFRDSMIEMIMEKKIKHPEELEELLACYLTLNSDEYHDVIVKVFRQVWFEMSRASLGAESQKEGSYYDLTS